MPGPCSYPALWDEKRRAPGHHGDRSRSGKTDFDRRSGKWLRHLRNQAERADRNKGRKA